MKKFAEATGRFLQYYLIITIVCIILDIIQYFNSLVKYGNTEQTVYAAVACVIISFIFLALDVYFILWAVSVKMKLPAYASGYIFLALLGFISKLTDQLNKKVDKAVANQQNKMNDPRKPAAK